MARFTATHGVQFQDDRGVWAQFTLDSSADSLEDGVAKKAYVFETEDADVAARLRKVDDFGIAEVEAVRAGRAKSEG